MFDLNHTKARMLQEINASEEAFANRVSDPADVAFASADEARLILRAKRPDELLPSLRTALCKRFALLAPEQLHGDLIYLLKKGVGNAYKWGNRKDPAKGISVEAVVTEGGAVVAISDDGEGFDVEGVVVKFRAGERFFTHGGSGFRHFEKARSLISYADGGRTLLIRFLCASKPRPDLPTADG